MSFTPTCWQWTDHLSKAGYPYFYLNGKTRLAHRITFELFKGPIPSDLVIDHICSNARCVNPDHLEAVSDTLNQARGLNHRPVRKHNFSGYRNVRYFPKRKKPWCVMHTFNKKQVFSGYFKDAEAAAAQANIVSARLWPGFRAFNDVRMG